MNVIVDTTTSRGERPRLTLPMKKALAEVVRAYVETHPEADEMLREGLRFLEDEAQLTPRKPRKKTPKAELDLGLEPLSVPVDVTVPEEVVTVVSGNGAPILL